MNRYLILETRLQWVEAARNEAGKPFDLYTVVFEPVGTAKALTAEAALEEAKRKGFHAPVIAPGSLGSLQ